MVTRLKAADPIRFPNGQPKIVSPIRFARFRGSENAISMGVKRNRPVESGCPPVDDHGFQPFYGGVCGPVVGFGVTEKKPCKVTVQVVRDLIGVKAKLFPEVENTKIAKVVVPAQGGYLPREIKNIYDVPGGYPYDLNHDRLVLELSGTSGATPVRLRYGSATGPVVAEMVLCALPWLEVPVRFYDVRIDGGGPPPRPGVSPATSASDIVSLFKDINVIYEQAGIRFTFDQLEPGSGLPVINLVDNSSLSNMYGQANRLSDPREVLHVLTLGRPPKRADGKKNPLNAYIVRGFGGKLKNNVGFGYSRKSAEQVVKENKDDDGIKLIQPVQPGIVFVGLGSPGTDVEMGQVARELLVHTIAHELGHCLDVEHYDKGVNRSDLPQSSVRNDLWAHSNLMHHFMLLESSRSTPPNNDPRFYNSVLRTNVGYGVDPSGAKYYAGQMLSFKDRAKSGTPDEEASDKTVPPKDCQVAIARNGCVEESYAQVPKK